MTFADAVNYLNDGRAAKRPNWGGYVKKVVTSEPGATTETFKIVFVERDANPTYEYVWDGTAWTAPATKVPFDHEILEAMLADDWITGETAAFEAARSGTGTW